MIGIPIWQFTHSRLLNQKKFKTGTLQKTRPVFNVHRLRPPLLITHRAAVLILQILGISLDIQDVAGRRVRLTCTRGIRARNRFKVRQSRVELRVVIERRHGLLLIGCGMEGGFQNEGFIRCFRVHGFLISAVTTELLQLRIRRILKKEII